MNMIYDNIDLYSVILNLNEDFGNYYFFYREGKSLLVKTSTLGDVEQTDPKRGKQPEIIFNDFDDNL